MKLVVDEDTQARRLLDALRHAGHDVLIRLCIQA